MGKTIAPPTPPQWYAGYSIVDVAEFIFYIQASCVLLNIIAFIFLIFEKTGLDIISAFIAHGFLAVNLMLLFIGMKTKKPSFMVPYMVIMVVISGFMILSLSYLFLILLTMTAEDRTAWELKYDKNYNFALYLECPYKLFAVVMEIWSLHILHRCYCYFQDLRRSPPAGLQLPSINLA